MNPSITPLIPLSLQEHTPQSMIFSRFAVLSLIVVLQYAPIVCLVKDEYAIKYMVGHSIADITERVYTKRDPDRLRTEIEKIK